MTLFYTIILGGITEESITGFVLANSMPLVVDFNQV
jgi:hypothetical protein